MMCEQGRAKGAGFTVWLTGLPSSGKTTIASGVAAHLKAAGRSVEVLDGDVLRQHLCKDLGFTRADRDENVSRVGFVAEILSRNGIGVLVALVSPFAEARRKVRERIPNFIEVHVHCPVAECERRDVKGFYALARSGRLSGLTGIDDPYEPPLRPELRIHTDTESVDVTVSRILHEIAERRL